MPSTVKEIMEKSKMIKLLRENEFVRDRSDHSLFMRGKSGVKLGSEGKFAGILNGHEVVGEGADCLYHALKDSL